MRTHEDAGAVSRTVLRHGTVVDAAGQRRADVALEGDTIQAVGEVAARPGDRVLDCAGRLILPGFIDAHSHAEGVVFDPATQLALLRQGVTTIIGGQDGVSYAPGDGRYASEYFAAINGSHPHYTGGGVAALLAAHDGRTALNMAYLVPSGTVRWEVMGRSTAPATAAELAQMQALVAQGMADGAVGLSSGLDYVPGMFADAPELAALCAPVAAAGGIYVTHMRGGYEANSQEGIEEIATICAGSGVKAHISHFHAAAPVVASMVGLLADRGVDTSFDAYPYTRGCSLLSMPLLPPELSLRPVPEILAVLADPLARAALIRDWFPVVATKPSLGPRWADMITLGHIAAPAFAWAHGLTLAEAAERVGHSPADFSLDVLLASRLEVNAIMAVRWDRDMAELGTIMDSPAHLAGSDGIFIGAHPHPRAAGSFPRYLATFVREHGSWSWRDAVAHLSAGSAARFGLGRRGRIAPGYAADVVLVDPGTVSDRASYARPTELAVGIDDVFVGGRQVLRAGELTGILSGQSLRRSRPAG